MEDARYSDARIVDVKLSEFFRICCLIEIVHFLEHPLTQFIDQRHQITADQTHVAIKPSGDVAHDVKIERDLLAQARPLHLHGHLLATLQHAPVHLAQGGRRDRFALQVFVDRVHRRPEVLLDAGHRQAGIEARQLVLELGQLLEQHRRNDVGPG